MGAMASQITRFALFTQSFIQEEIKENTKAPRHVRGIHRWPANSIWWRHHENDEGEVLVVLCNTHLVDINKSIYAHAN